MATVDEIRVKYGIVQCDAPRTRSVSEKMDRSLKLLRERAQKGGDISRIMEYRRSLKNSAEAQKNKKNYKVRVTYTSRVDAVSPQEAVAIARAQVNKGTQTAFNTVEKSEIVK